MAPAADPRANARRTLVVAAVTFVLLAAPGSASSAVAVSSVSSVSAVDAMQVVGSADDDAEAWVWPVEGRREVVEPFRAPANEYGPGHRGMDIAAPVTAEVRAPFDGAVAFRGAVVDRALITLELGDGIVVTLEPLESSLPIGEPVAEGQVVGTVSTGGHTASGRLHVGVRVADEYVNPLPFFGRPPRAVLYPCCAG